MKTDHVPLSDEQFGRLLDDMAARFAPVAEEKTRQAMKDLGLTAADRRHAVFPGVADDTDLPARERSYRFFKAVLSGDVMATKALSETDGSGGYLVPSGFREEVVARLPELAELAPHVRVVPVRTYTGSLPSLATDIAIGWASTADAETNGVNETTPTLGSVTWSLKRADAFTKISRELVADAQPSVIEFVTRLFREAIAAERDKMIAVGNGTSQPYGLYSASGLDSVAVDGSLAFETLVEIEQTLARKYRARARWVMSSVNARRVFGMTDTQGQPVFRRDAVAGMPESRLLGYPVATQDDLPDDLILFGDLSQYLWFDREEMGVESTAVGGDAFANHQVWIKVWERADGKLGLADAFVKGTGITDA